MNEDRWHWAETFTGFMAGAVLAVIVIVTTTTPLPEGMVCTARNIETGECLAYVKKG